MMRVLASEQCDKFFVARMRARMGADFEEQFLSLRELVFAAELCLRNKVSPVRFL